MTEVTPNWKTPPAEKDPQVLREIHAAWQPYGCAICGWRPGESDPHIEVHHIIPRSQGGDDSWSNTLGLCPELAPGKCHWRVTTNRVTIDLVAGVGWVWTDRITHEEGVCRVLHQEKLEVIPKPDIQAELNRLEQRKPRIDPDRLPDISKLPAGKEGAEQRFQVAQALWRGVNRDLLLLSLIAYDVSARAEFQELGFRSIRAWGDAVGIWSGTLSKMLQVAKCFQGAWIDLPADQQADLTVDRLYFAKQLLDYGRYEDREEALHAAVATPQRYLWQELKRARGATFGETQHRCPDCGFLHHILTKGEEGGDAPVRPG